MKVVPSLGSLGGASGSLGVPCGSPSWAHGDACDLRNDQNSMEMRIQVDKGQIGKEYPLLQIDEKREHIYVKQHAIALLFSLGTVC